MASTNVAVVAELERLTAAAARRIALAAQGFADPGRPGGSTAATSAGWSTSGCCRSTRSTCCRARTTCRCSPGSAPTRATGSTSSPGAPAGRCGNSSTGRTRRRSCPLRPVAAAPLAHGAGRGSALGRARVAEEKPGLLATVLDEVRDRGALRAREVGDAVAAAGPGGCGIGGQGRAARRCSPARSTVAERVNFERRYDLPERVLPPPIVAAPAVPEDEARRELLRISARALGVATGPTSTTTSGSTARDRATAGRAGRGRRARAGDGAWLGAGRPTSGRAPGCRGGCEPGRCSRPSTRWWFSGRASSGSSTSATASRSTSRRPSGSTATTCCRSCSATGSWPGSTSRPTGRPGCCGAVGVGRADAPGDVGTGRPRARGRAARAGGLAGARRRRRVRRAAISRPRSPRRWRAEPVSGPPSPRPRDGLGSVAPRHEGVPVMTDLSTVLLATAERFPDRPAVKLDDHVLTYAELRRRRPAVAAGCVARGRRARRPGRAGAAQRAGLPGARSTARCSPARSSCR